MNTHNSSTRTASVNPSKPTPNAVPTLNTGQAQSGVHRARDPQGVMLAGQTKTQDQTGESNAGNLHLPLDNINNNNRETVKGQESN
jgi:hypothetical protein